VTAPEGEPRACRDAADAVDGLLMTVTSLRRAGHLDRHAEAVLRQ
jgi:hypothetical protein